MISHSENEPSSGFWDIKDLSYYLKIKVKTLYAMTSDIPHYRVGKLIRFRKQEIDFWMENKKANAPDGTNKSRKRKINLPIDRLVRKTIDQSKNEVYNPDHGKSDRIEGPRKEINNGSI